MQIIGFLISRVQIELNFFNYNAAVQSTKDPSIIEINESIYRFFE